MTHQRKGERNKMKLIKKIAAIMFAFMMVVSMSCNVKAVEGTSPATKGTITITNAKKGETYKLYKILSLESYSYTENDKKMVTMLID